MRTDAFDYELPREWIAQHPSQRRDESRLLVLERDTGQVCHRRFRQVGEFLRPGDLLVLNDTKVIPARLVGRRETGGWVELLLLGHWTPESDEVTCRTLAKCRGRLREGESLEIEDGALACTLARKLDGGEVELRFHCGQEALWQVLRRVGRAPLPPYIKRPRREDPDRRRDRERYQTVYAQREGAVAAPTAGLHFTEELLQRLEDQGIGRTTVTLHVGMGTFKPIKTETVDAHEMHSEYYEVSEAAIAAIESARRAGGRIVPVGTTSTRVLEALARGPGLRAASGWTDLYIKPGFTFELTDALITNFHLPRSTLLVLVSAFAGRERILAAYEEAKREGYRFYSYGDAMLIL
jgi:S-adenosylmethionine:tRNA ribosyltransferase-isomerase